jgi:hypothetical protein
MQLRLEPKLNAWDDAAQMYVKKSPGEWVQTATKPKAAVNFASNSTGGCFAGCF